MDMRIHKINIHPDKNEGKPCTGETEVYSRVTGFYRPTSQFNRGKAEEYRQRKVFRVDEDERNQR